jgi:hypothetical protein
VVVRPFCSRFLDEGLDRRLWILFATPHPVRHLRTHSLKANNPTASIVKVFRPSTANLLSFSTVGHRSFARGPYGQRKRIILGLNNMYKSAGPNRHRVSECCLSSTNSDSVRRSGIKDYDQLSSMGPHESCRRTGYGISICCIQIEAAHPFSQHHTGATGISFSLNAQFNVIHAAVDPQSRPASPS